MTSSRLLFLMYDIELGICVKYTVCVGVSYTYIEVATALSKMSHKNLPLLAYFCRSYKPKINTEVG